MFPNSHPHPDVSITVWKTWEESHYTMNMLHYTMSMRHYTMNMLHYTMNMRHYSMNMLHYTMNMSRYTMNMRHEQKYKNLRNRKHFPCFHTVIETRVEVWENEKLKWENEPVGRVFSRNFSFSQTCTSVSTTYENTRGKMISTFFIK